MSEFGQQLRVYRNNSTDPNKGGRLTQQGLAELLENYAGVPGYSYVRVSNWERGREEISHTNRQLLVGLIKVLHDHGGIHTLEMANEWLSIGGYGHLKPIEISQVDTAWQTTQLKEIGPVEAYLLEPQPTISSVIQPEPPPEVTLTKQQQITLLTTIPTSLIYFVLIIYRWLRPYQSTLIVTTVIILTLSLTITLTAIHHRHHLQAILLPIRLLMLWLITILLLISFYGILPAITQWYVIKGTDELEAGNAALALSHFIQANSLSPNNAYVHYGSGNAYEAMGNNTKAITAYEKVHQLDSNFWPMYNNLGRLYLEEGQPDKALQTLEAGFRLEAIIPPREQAIFRKNLGRAYFETNKPSQAKDLLEEAKTGFEIEEQAGDTIFIYLAETYYWLAHVYEHEQINQPTAAQDAWANTYNYARYILNSDRCLAPDPLLTDCLDAKKWLEEARPHKE